VGIPAAVCFAFDFVFVSIVRPTGSLCDEPRQVWTDLYFRMKRAALAFCPGADPEIRSSFVSRHDFRVDSSSSSTLD
jgi:hypothetical protein